MKIKIKIIRNTVSFFLFSRKRIKIQPFTILKMVCFYACADELSKICSNIETRLIFLSLPSLISCAFISFLYLFLFEGKRIEVIRPQVRFIYFSCVFIYSSNSLFRLSLFYSFVLLLLLFFFLRLSIQLFFSGFLSFFIFSFFHSFTLHISHTSLVSFALFTHSSVVLMIQCAIFHFIHSFVLPFLY